MLRQKNKEAFPLKRFRKPEPKKKKKKCLIFQLYRCNNGAFELLEFSLSLPPPPPPFSLPFSLSTALNGVKNSFSFLRRNYRKTEQKKKNCSNYSVSCAIENGRKCFFLKAFFVSDADGHLKTSELFFDVIIYRINHDYLLYKRRKSKKKKKCFYGKFVLGREWEGYLSSKTCRQTWGIGESHMKIYFSTFLSLSLSLPSNYPRFRLITAAIVKRF